MTQQFSKTAPRTVAPRNAPVQHTTQAQPDVTRDQSLPLVPHHVSYADAVKKMCLTDFRSNPKYQGDFGPQEAGKMKAPYQEPEVLKAPEGASAAEIRTLHKAVQIRNRAARPIAAPFLSMSVTHVRQAAALALNGASVPVGGIEDIFDAVTSDLYGTVSLQGYVVANGSVTRRFFVNLQLNIEVDGPTDRRFFVRPIEKNTRLARKQLWSHLTESQPGDVIVIVARPEKRKYSTGREQYEHIKSCVHVLKVQASTIDA